LKIGYVFLAFVRPFPFRILFSLFFLAFGVGQVWTKSTASIASHFRQANTELLPYMSFQSGQQHIWPFKPFPIQPKASFSI
jgi:hypothetical protein